MEQQLCENQMPEDHNYFEADRVGRLLAAKQNCEARELANVTNKHCRHNLEAGLKA